MLPLIFTSLIIVAPPGGWQQTSAPPGLAAGAYETVAYSSGGDASFTVMLFRAEELEAMFRRTAAELGGREATIDPASSVDDSRNKQTSLRRADGRQVFIRAYREASSAVVAACVGEGVLLADCKASLFKVLVHAGEPGREQPAELDYVGSLLTWIVVGLIGLVLLATGLGWLLRRRRLARSPALVEGELLTISGVIRAVEPLLEAPLSGRACVGHRSHARVMLRERVTGEPAEQEGVAFAIETRHGLIQASGDALVFDTQPAVVVDQATERQRAFRERHAIPSSASVAFDEIVLVPGANVTLRGIVSRERDLGDTGERGYRDDAPTTLRLAGTLTVTRTW